MTVQLYASPRLWEVAIAVVTLVLPWEGGTSARHVEFDVIKLRSWVSSISQVLGTCYTKKYCRATQMEVAKHVLTDSDIVTGMFHVVDT